MQPPISIIIPCYNKGAYITETLESVHNQTISKLETIIINDGSTDESVEVIEKFINAHEFENRHYKLINQKNQGVSAARNTGIKSANGYYILPLDADDTIEPTYAQEAIAHLDTHPETKVVYSRVQFLGSKTGEMTLGQYHYNNLLWGALLPSTIIYRKSDYLSTPNGYNPNMIYGYEDWDFLLSLLHPDDKVYQINKILVHYRIVDNGRNQLSSEHETAMLRQLYLNHAELYEEYNDMLIEAYDKWHEYESLYHKVIKSKAYRIGKIITKWYNRFIKH